MTSALLHPFSKPSSDNFRTLVRSEGVRSGMTKAMNISMV